MKMEEAGESISQLEYAQDDNPILGESGIPKMLTDGDTFLSRLYHSGLILDHCFTPFLCLFGTLGNSLSLIVFYLDANYRNQSAPFYLSALAITDTVFLLNLFFVWLEGIYEGRVITSNFTCPLVMYLGQVSSCISVYLIVAFSAERYVAVHNPFSRPRLCTRSKAKKAIGTLTIFALVGFSYVWVIAQVIDISGDKRGQTYSNETGVEQQVMELSLSNEQFEEVDDDPSGLGKGNNGPVMRSRNPATELHPDYGDNSGKDVLSEMLTLEHNSPNPDQVVSHGESNSEKDSTSSSRQHDHHHYSPQLRCSVPEEYYHISEFANYVDTVVTLVIPFTLITYFNMRIAICVWKLKNQREEIMVMGKMEAKSSSSLVLAHHGGRRRMEGNYKNETGKLDDDDDDSSGSNISKGGRNHYHERSSLGSSRGGTQVMFEIQKGKDTSNGVKSPRRGVRFQSDEEPQEHQHSLLVPSSSTGSSSPSISRNNRLKLSTIRKKGTGSKNDDQHNHASTSAEVRVTKTLLLISCMFLLLNLPAHFVRCAQFILSVTGASTGRNYLLAVFPWTYILFNMSFAVNFLLYCASGRNFRASLLNIFLKLFGKRHHGSSSFQPQSRSLLSRMRWKRRNSAGLATTTIRLSTSALNEDCDGGEGEVEEGLSLESGMQANGIVATCIGIGDNGMSVSV